MRSFPVVVACALVLYSFGAETANESCPTLGKAREAFIGGFALKNLGVAGLV